LALARQLCSRARLAEHNANSQSQAQ